MPNLKSNDSTAAGSAEVRYYSRSVEALNLGVIGPWLTTISLPSSGSAGYGRRTGT